MTFLSHAQNFEDLMLWRGLSDVTAGFYIDVGAGDPDSNTVTRAFYDHGWSGVNIEPDDVPFQALVRQRPRDINLPIALADTDGDRRFFLPAMQGLGTLDSGIAFQHRSRGIEVRRIRVTVRTLADICRQHAPQDIHFLNIDVQGAEALVLQGADWTAFRPWIVVAQSTLPLTRQEIHAAWEPLLTAAAYRFVWFDGLNRFYVAEERYEALSPHFRLPPNCFDRWQRADPESAALSRELEAARGACRAAKDEVRALQARLTDLRGALRHAADKAEAW
jgi:FkbM family methyltransferase